VKLHPEPALRFPVDPVFFGSTGKRSTVRSTEAKFPQRELLLSALRAVLATQVDPKGTGST